MKPLILILLLTNAGFLQAQPVVKADALALLAEMPEPAANLTDAYQRAYAPGATNADTKPFYQSTLNKLVQVQEEAKQLAIQFYQQYPSGMPATPQQASNRVSAKDRAAMDAATSELAQKMLADPDFAKKFAQMSESEQQTYLVKLLADKGLKPASGSPNSPMAALPGTDIAWMDLCIAFNDPAFGLHRWDRQMELQQRYDMQHEAVNTWIETEIKKLPLISMGEYGHDYDPAQVKSIQKQGLEKHCHLANEHLKEAASLFKTFRQEARSRMAPLNEALKQVNYGANYSFGLHYNLVLQTQTMMLADLHTILNNERGFIESLAHWEFERVNFK